MRGRRAGESRNVYVDVYLASDLILVAMVFGLNVFDAGMTLHHLGRGAIEQNPLMDQLIQWGPVWFVLEKVVVIGLCMAALLIHKTFGIARRAALVLLAAYGLLMIQHLSLL